ncbi:MAG: hypothetical protein KC416_07905 [Myxococcales bacterium]|nr:hypothetical protein [Myxococcales bacterium]
MRGASAPGKLMLAGEYVVLFEGSALVTAVSRRARVFRSATGNNGSGLRGDGSRENGSVSPEVLLAIQLARRAFPSESLGPLDIDVSELRNQREGKYGLGSSAATAVAAAGLVAQAAGRTLDDPGTRREILPIAWEAHRVIAPGGSGADIAAANFGGTLEVEPQRSSPPHTNPVDWPRGLIARAVWTRKVARTNEMVARVRDFGESNPAALRQALRPLRDAADRVTDAFRRQSVPDLIGAVREHHQALAGLGHTTGTPIVEDTLERTAHLAEEYGGGAKPSGAGGGDVAFACFAQEDAADRFDGACRAAGLVPLDLTFHADGLRGEFLSTGATP